MGGTLAAPDKYVRAPDRSGLRLLSSKFHIPISTGSFVQFLLIVYLRVGSGNCNSPSHTPKAVYLVLLEVRYCFTPFYLTFKQTRTPEHDKAKTRSC